MAIKISPRLSVPQLNELESAVTIKKQKKIDLFIAGERVEALYILKEGFVRNYIIYENGVEFSINLVGPGSHIPIIPVFTGEPLNFHIQTLTECSIEKLSIEETREVIADPRYGGKLALAVSSLVTRMQDLTATSAKERVYASLTYLYRKLDGVNGLIPLTLNQEIIASFAGVNRETCSRALTELSKQGKISLKQKQYTIIEHE